MNAETVKPVVVGLDRSDIGRAAVEFAAELARRQHRPLRLVHAYEFMQTTVRPSYGWTPDLEDVVRNAAQRLMDETVEVLGIVYPDLAVTAVLQRGSSVTTLLEESRNAEVVVLGSRGTGGFADLMIGSTTLHVAAHATCPVVAIPSLSDAENPRHGVVVGVDGSELSEAAIGYAFETASELGEKLTAVHVWQDPTSTGFGRLMPGAFDRSEVGKADSAALTDSMSGWLLKFPNVQVEQDLVLGHPVEILVSRAAQARLLVVGCRGRGALSSLLLGSVSHGVLHHAKGPVAVVHHNG